MAPEVAKVAPAWPLSGQVLSPSPKVEEASQASQRTPVARKGETWCLSSAGTTPQPVRLEEKVVLFISLVMTLSENLPEAVVAPKTRMHAHHTHIQHTCTGTHTEALT